ncbi:MAG TPA: SRPBCC family protein [Verrucomicrobiae bacterium]|nr:SRPBCC family protein [Verrucomicrobiae bacterium]
MLIKILVALVVIAVVFIVIVAMRPSDFRVTRSTVISAGPAAIFAEVNDLHRWQAWSPWEKIDPALKRTYDGPPAGTGAIYSWVGNNKVGEGRMTVTESRPPELVRFRLEFLKPFKATNMAEFTFKPEGARTVVTWSMTGKYNFVMKAAGLFMNCEKMVGGEFEKGLANLKSIAEAAPQETNRGATVASLGQTR